MFSLFTRVDGLADQQYRSLVKHFNHLKEIITMNKEELEAKLNALADQNDKASAEQAAAMQALRDELAAANVSTPGIDAALERLATSIQKDDDENPDAVTE